MTKRAIIVHCWDGDPNYAWYPWLKDQLEARGFVVEVPQMPDTEAPRIEPWVSMLASIVGQPDEDTYLIGHSIGCQTILRYLASLSDDAKIGGAVLVAGFYTLVPLEGEQAITAEPWLTTPIDAEAVKAHVKRIISIFSDNDHWVPTENEQLIKDRLSAETHMLHDRKHFSGSTLELPEALETIVRISV